jgi:hypothetical protein
VAVAPIADVTMRATVWRAATTPVFVPIAATPTVPSPVQPEPSPFELGSWGSGSNETAPAWAGHVPVWLTLVAFAVGVIAGATLI